MKVNLPERARLPAAARTQISPRQTLLRYGLALLAVAIAVLCRAPLEGVLGHRSAFPLFTLAVMLSGWYGGFKPGMLATVLGGLAGTFLFLDPGVGVPDPLQLWQLGLFLVVGTGISWLNEEHKRAENTLARLAAIVANSDDAIIGLALDGTILTWNAGAERIYGYPRDQVLGRPLSMLMPPDGAAEAAGLLETVGRGGRIVNRESKRLRRDGRTILVSLTISPIRDNTGAVTGLSAIERDITEKRRLEERAWRAQKLESLGTLAGGVAHDFNNLLTGIIGNVNLALEEMPESSRWRPMLEEVQAASERAARLTMRMLAYSGNSRFVVEPLDLSDLARQTGALLEATLAPNVELRYELAEGLPAVHADRTQIEQLIVDLVINAGEAISPGRPGAVTLATAARVFEEAPSEDSSTEGRIERGQYVSLEVRDSGCGIAPEIRPRIFDPFFSTKFTGRGLGLAAALGIVRGHHGAMQVESAPGEGSTFRVLLPAAAESTVTAATPGRSRSGPADSAGPPGSAR
jgi:two-component system cell cycle sensor histidine kinase/response regulator CckA